MNQRLMVVLLFLTIVLSLTSMIVVFSVNSSESVDLTNFGRLIESNQRASVGLVIQSPTGGTG